MALRCLIVDDSDGFIRAATELLEREGATVVGAAADGEVIVALARETRPDVVLIDLDLGVESGIDVARRLEAALGDGAPPMVLISTYGEPDVAELVAAAPVLGFVSKSALSRHRLDALLSASPGT
jgi:DNA-binding NarL/FixJ family response regulator